MMLECSNSDFNRDHNTGVRTRPQFEGEKKLLCDPCWKDYQQDIYEMWRGHVG